MSNFFKLIINLIDVLKDISIITQPIAQHVLITVKHATFRLHNAYHAMAAIESTGMLITPACNLIQYIIVRC